MDTIIIACQILKQELQYVMQKNGIQYPIIWLESTLHDRTATLHQCLEETLAETKAQRIFLTYGQCGCATIGLNYDYGELILPKVDDCITLLLGSCTLRNELNASLNAYYLTEGWISGKKSPLKDFEKIYARYGEKRGKRIIDTMYQHYQRLCILDTGLYDVSKLCEACQPIAKITQTTLCTHRATLSWLEQLITGPWEPQKFVIKKPGEAIREADFL